MKNFLIILLSLILMISVSAYAETAEAPVPEGESLDITSYLGQPAEALQEQIGPELVKVDDLCYTIENWLAVFQENGQITFLSLLPEAEDGRYTIFGVYPGMSMADAETLLTEAGWTPDEERFIWEGETGEVTVAEQDGVVVNIVYTIKRD